jgi:hypothetical protein
MGIIEASVNQVALIVTSQQLEKSGKLFSFCGWLLLSTVAVAFDSSSETCKRLQNGSGDSARENFAKIAKARMVLKFTNVAKTRMFLKAAFGLTYYSPEPNLISKIYKLEVGLCSCYRLNISYFSIVFTGVLLVSKLYIMVIEP